MIKKEMKLFVLRLLDYKCKEAYRKFLECKANEEAHIAGHTQWEREHPDDGVGCFSMNKWNPDNAKAARTAAEKEYKNLQEICDYALVALIE